MNLLKKLLGCFTLVFGGFLAVFIVLYVLNVWMMVNRLPFCQEAALAWLMGVPTTVCATGDIAAGVPTRGYHGPATAIQGLPVAYPVKYFFGHDPNYFGGTWHGGVDMPCPVGTPIQATMGGRVSFAGTSEAGYGTLVVIENRGYQTFYAHASSTKVAVGDTVEAGDVIALSGNTGYSTGPHLHYEVRVDGQQRDPLEVNLPGSADQER
jgi:hypothetical protein